MWTAKAQIRLRRCAVWSGPSLSSYRITGYHILYERRVKAMIILWGCAGWSEPVYSRMLKTPFRLTWPVYCPQDIILRCDARVATYRILVARILTLIMLWADSADDKLVIFFIFTQKIGSDTSCKLSPEETICIKCQVLFSRKKKKNKKYISKCRLLKFYQECKAL